MSSPALLVNILRSVTRRYRLPQGAAASAIEIRSASPATSLAFAIEAAREATVHGETPDAALKQRFIDALAAMIHEAMRADSGDRAFQAMVLRHRAVQVREYASLSAHADQDRRQIHTMVNAIAHPAKQQRAMEGWQREALARLHSSASAPPCSRLRDTARNVLDLPEIVSGSEFGHAVARLLNSAALARACRLETLESDPLVQQYRSLWDAYGPRPGSPEARAQGKASQQRGAAVEALAIRALETLARQLNEATPRHGPSYRAVNSMRVPAAIPGSHEHAKTEWDAVLLERVLTQAADAAPVWNVCLLVEAKASIEAATTDLPRLMRGIRLLAHAGEGAVYAFETRQGTVHIDGASLRALNTEPSGLNRTVLYCCDAPADGEPRLLGAASRTRLLSAQASLEFARASCGEPPRSPEALEPVWRELTRCPQWHGVLHQYPTLQLVRELMVHPDDLMAAMTDASGRM
ncbi:hypothetical protein SAMN05421548_1288 [Paraburkholderia lycopersici]|uniref:3-deoxy-D-arabino-heptulosonate 7-phosphate synthase n=2 Tax=Paraburkholderia lycopersici TaxID=416944 RepID=A0A1G6YJY4_9BURK|nr:3-deoxy-D-arabino-heptulosonate 7-phosphate synthase [Paraburkholderia lycopersici]SDD90601.1 hypothetical protein SAMN05421548_1288 [Paraburkholderia lycopersici]